MAALQDPYLNRLNKQAAARRSKPSRIISSLSLEPGHIIADLGAGGGYYATLFAQEVGPGGLIIAVDTMEERLAYVQQQANHQKLNNIAIHIIDKDHLVLPNIKFDLIFSRNMFHHLEDPQHYFDGISNHLKKHGRVAVIDYKPPTNLLSSLLSRRHRFSDPDRIKDVFFHAGLLLECSFDFLPEQSFQIFSCEINEGLKK